MQPAVRLAAGSWSLVADPGHGGRIVDCRFMGQPVFRPGRTGLWPDQEHAGCFPLVPYSNRIRDNRFTGPFGQVDLQPPDFSPSHALHGSGWRKAWTVTDISPTGMHMQLSSEGGGWPWRFEARQNWKVEDNTLRAEISITNLSSRPMPAGIGLHPYFAEAASLRPHVHVTGVWDILSTELPLPVTWKKLDPETDFFSAAPVNLAHIDHCLTGWDRRIRLENQKDGRTIEMSAGPTFANLVVYRPPDSDILCAEPVSHVPNAFNLADLPAEQDVVRLQPAERLTGWICLTVIGSGQRAPE